MSLNASESEEPREDASKRAGASRAPQQGHHQQQQHPRQQQQPRQPQPAPRPSERSPSARPTPDTQRKRIASCMIQDQRRLSQRLAAIERSDRRPSAQALEEALIRLQRDIDRSQARRDRRAASAPRPVFPTDLPISERRQEIVEAINRHQVVIVCGETGSGKSTQLPKICIAAGRGVAGMIGHTQPRRIAARSVSTRLAEELGARLGEVVGYKVRFGDQTSSATMVKVMTDGILLAEVQSDPLLEQYDTIIIDEAHERSLNIDFILGYLRQLLPKRPDLKLIITSATIDPERFSKHFDGAPIILVSGRTYPVDVRYREISAQDEDELEDTMEHAIVSAVAEIAGETEGDILVFLASEREIRETIELLEAAGWGKHAEILPLLARLSAGEQMRVFQPGTKRRIVLATNIAETSITVPGVRGVIDCGFARISHYSPKTKVQRLPIEAISRASAQQRAGRCGRIGAGICVRLYSEIDFNARPEFTTPEIHRTNLASVLLQMKALRLGDPATFPFVEPPDERMIADAYETLRHLQAVDESGELTPMGVLMARLPVEPTVARIILAARENELLAATARKRPPNAPTQAGRRGRASAGVHASPAPAPAALTSVDRETRAMMGALEEVLIIVAAMSVIDPRERPIAEQQKADAMHRRFRDELSDFVSLLKLWWYYKDQSARLTSSRLRKLCRAEYLSFVRLREWEDVHRQLLEMISELPGGSVGLAGAGTIGQAPGQGHDARREEQRRHARRDQLLPRQTQRRELHGAPIPGTSREEKPLSVPISPLYEAIHRAMLTGLISNVGKRGKESGGFEYDGARSVKFAIFPGSGLFKANPDWLVAGELVRTTKLYARAVARVKPEWIEQAGAHLLKRSHLEPHYDERGARVMAYERVSLLGLVLVEKRRVHFGAIDPKLSREIFIQHALVEGLLPTRAEFMAHNQALVQEARQLQHKLRRLDILADTSRRFAFFDDRVPQDIHSGAAFEKWRFEAEAESPRLLFMRRSDVVALPEELDLDTLYPDAIELGSHTSSLRYLYNPGADDDGVTSVLSIDDLPSLDDRPGQWLVPGLLVEKVELLIRSLPKRLRAAFSPVEPVAREIVLGPQRLWQPSRPLIDALSQRLSEMARTEVYPQDFGAATLEPHLRMNYLVKDRAGRALAQGRDVGELRTHLHRKLARAIESTPAPEYQIDGLTDWTFGDLPERVELTLEGGVCVSAYPAIWAEASGGASLRLLASRAEALEAHRLGQVRLFRLAIAQELRKYLSSIKGFGQLSLLHSPLGTPEQLRDAIAERACELTFVRDGAMVRAQAEFRRRLKPAEPWIDDQIKVTAELFNEVLTERQRVAMTLSTMEEAFLAPVRDDAMSQLLALIREGFLVNTPLRWFSQYPRYLRALDRRLARARLGGNPQVERDRRLAADVRTRESLASAVADSMSPDDPRWPDLREYRWLLHEYRVSLFAQELAMPVASLLHATPRGLDERWSKLTGR